MTLLLNWSMIRFLKLCFKNYVSISTNGIKIFYHMDKAILNQFLESSRIHRKIIYSLQIPRTVILDIDSTFLDVYGKQERGAFNLNYQNNSLLPVMAEWLAI